MNENFLNAFFQEIFSMHKWRLGLFGQTEKKVLVYRPNGSIFMTLKTVDRKKKRRIESFFKTTAHNSKSEKSSNRKL